MLVCTQSETILALLLRLAHRYPCLCLCVAAAIPLVLYVAAGYGGQDFQFHYTLWLALHDAWSKQEWSLGWSPAANYELGEPSLCFYPPLSPLIGAALSFVLPARMLPGAVAWLVLVMSGACMYYAAEHLLEPRYRLTAALLYVFSPCVFLVLILRGSVAEAWVTALLPLAFVLFYRVVSQGEYAVAGFASCVLAAAWLFDIPVAIGLFYAFLFIAAVLAIRTHSWMPFIAGALVEGFAVFIASFRLLPALYEKHWISPEGLLLYDFRNSLQLLSYTRGNFPLDHAAVVLVVSCVLIGILYWRGDAPGSERTGSLRLSLFCLAVFAVFFQLPISIPLWKLLPQFRFVLFAYRLLSMLVMAVVIGLFTSQVSGKLRSLASLALLGCSLVSVVLFLRLPPSQHFHTFSELEKSVQNGYQGVREYLPVNAPAFLRDPLKQQEFLRSAETHQGGNCAPAVMQRGPNLLVLQTQSSTTCTLQWDVFAYPFWHAFLDGSTPLPLETNPFSLLQVNVPAGNHRVSFEFSPRSPVRTFSGWFSLFAFLLAAGWYWLVRGRWASAPPNSRTSKVDRSAWDRSSRPESAFSWLRVLPWLLCTKAKAQMM